MSFSSAQITSICFFVLITLFINFLESMGSSYKTTLFFICLISFDCGLEIDAGRHQSQSHLASLLAGGLITLMLQEAVKGKGGGFSSFRNALLLPNHQIHPETLNTPLSIYGSFSNFENYRNIPEIPIFGHSFGMKPFFQSPAALKYHTSALIGNFIETQRFPSVGQNFANPYSFGFQTPSPVALNYNLDYFFTLRGLCKNIAKLNIKDLHTNTLDNLVGVKNSNKNFERILQSGLEKKHPKILQDIYFQGIREKEIQNGPGYFPQEFQQNINEEQQKNQMHDFPHNVRQGHPEYIPWQFIEDIPNNIREGHRENLPQHLVNNAGQGHRENLPVYLQQHFPTNAGHGPRENLPVHLQQLFPTNAGQGHRENIPQHFPNNAGQGHQQNLPENSAQHFPNDAGQELRENLPQHNTQNNLEGKNYQNPTKHFFQDSPPDVKQSYTQNLPHNSPEDFYQNLPIHSVEDFPRHVKQSYQKNNQQTTQQYVPQQHQKSLTQDFPNNFEDDLQQQLAKDFNQNFANGFLEYVTQDNLHNGAQNHPENVSRTENSPPKLNHSSHLYIQRNEFNQTSDSKTDGSDISFPTEEKGEKNNKSESSFIDEIFIVNI